jgi:hypothetical protein
LEHMEPPTVEQHAEQAVDLSRCRMKCEASVAPEAVHVLEHHSGHHAPRATDVPQCLVEIQGGVRVVDCTARARTSPLCPKKCSGMQSDSSEPAGSKQCVSASLEECANKLNGLQPHSGKPDNLFADQHEGLSPGCNGVRPLRCTCDACDGMVCLRQQECRHQGAPGTAWHDRSGKIEPHFSGDIPLWVLRTDHEETANGAAPRSTHDEMLKGSSTDSSVLPDWLNDSPSTQPATHKPTCSTPARLQSWERSQSAQADSLRGWRDGVFYLLSFSITSPDVALGNTEGLGSPTRTHLKCEEHLKLDDWARATRTLLIGNDSQC